MEAALGNGGRFCWQTECVASPLILDVTQTIINANQLNHPIKMPTSVNPGELLLMVVSIDGNPVVTDPPGWTPLYDTAISTFVTGACWAKIADGSESNATVDVVTDALEQAAAQVLRITQWAGTLASVVAGTPLAVQTVGSTADAPAVTATWGVADNLYLATMHNSSATTIIAIPPNYTDVTKTNEGSGTAAGQVATCRRLLAAATDDPGNWQFANTAVSVVADTLVIRGNAAVGDTLATQRTRIQGPS